MEAIQNILPKGLPVTVQIIIATILLSLVYSFLTKNRPWSNFPLIKVRGLGPRKSWLAHGDEVLTEGLKKVYPSPRFR